MRLRASCFVKSFSERRKDECTSPPPPPPHTHTHTPVVQCSLCWKILCLLRGRWKKIAPTATKKEFLFVAVGTIFFQRRPPPPPTTLIPHIEVGFKWMWTQLATPNKMAPVFVNLCAGLVVLLPRQIRRFRHGFFSSAVLDWSLRSCLRVRHLWRHQIADNRRYLRRSFLPEHRHYEVKSRCRSAGNATMVKPLDEAVSNFFFEPSLSEKFGLWKIPIGNHIHLNLTSMCGFSLNPPPPPPLSARSCYSAPRNFFPKLCLILKEWFLTRFPPNFQERFLMFSASPEFVFWGPKIKQFCVKQV